MKQENSTLLISLDGEDSKQELECAANAIKDFLNTQQELDEWEYAEQT